MANEITATTERITSDILDAYGLKVVEKGIASTVDVAQDVSDTVILTLSKEWLGISLAKPAKTDDSRFVDQFKDAFWLKEKTGQYNYSGEFGRKPIDRFDTSKLWSLQLGDYFMPLSQTFRLQAKKRLNVSSLVDGVDIIQQTRKEAKTIECSLRLTLRRNQPNLEIVRFDDQNNASLAEIDSDVVAPATEAMKTFNDFLTRFYEQDEIFEVRNDTINRMFGVKYVFISQYQFEPLVGKGTFNFNFSLTEVSYSPDTVTFEVREISGDQKTQE